MLTVTFHNPREVDASKLKYAVICARYEGKWFLSRHNSRSTWGIPGGHIEPGETALKAAKRELWEETGASDADIRPVCVYAVNRDGVPTYGLLCFAEVSRLGSIPKESEIQEARLFSSLPDTLTYPDIQPHLFDKVQGWLNVQSGAGEMWDVYDANRNLTGKLHRRGEDLLPGEYHLVVHIWIQNNHGQFLMTRRSPNKGFPLMWETTGGSAISGDDSLTAALREVREETGLKLTPVHGRIIHQYSGSDYHVDVWLFQHDVNLEEVKLQEGETCDKRLSTPGDILAGAEKGEIVPYQYLKDWMKRGYLMTIRKASMQDVSSAATLACLLWPDNSQAEMEEEFCRLLNREDASIFLAEADGIPVGFAQCQLRRDYVEGTNSSPVGYLEGIFVTEEYRHKGIAKELLAACEGWSKGLGCTEFASDCELHNYESYRFHLALGFLEANRIICFTKEIGEKK